MFTLSHTHTFILNVISFHPNQVASFPCYDKSLFYCNASWNVGLLCCALLTMTELCPGRIQQQRTAHDSSVTKVKSRGRKRKKKHRLGNYATWGCTYNIRYYILSLHHAPFFSLFLSLLFLHTCRSSLVIACGQLLIVIVSK